MMKKTIMGVATVATLVGLAACNQASTGSSGGIAPKLYTDS